MRRLGPIGVKRRPVVRTSGTLAAGAAAQDIVDGGGTLILTVSATQWHSDLGSDSAATSALLNGIVSQQAEAGGWNAVVTAGLTFAHVSRDSDTVVTVTLPAFAGYSVTAGEAVAVTVPSAALADGALLGAVGFGVAAAVVDWVWAGALGSNGFSVVAGTGVGQSAVTLQVATDGSLQSLVFESAAAATTLLSSDGATLNVARFEVEGLAPDTAYFYAIATNGVPDLGQLGQVRTVVPALSAGDFRVVLGSCSDPGAGDPDGVFDAIEDTGALLFVHMGDLHYESIADDDLPRARAGIRTHLKLPKVASLYRQMPVAYTYDDHDFGPNNNHQGSPIFSSFAANTVTAYRDLVPHYPVSHPAGVGWTRGIAQVWTIGRVRFLMPDLRVHRAIGAAPGTILGDGRTTGGFASWDQKQWLKDQFDQARTDGIKLVMLISASTVLSNDGNAWESQADWTAELSEVLAYGTAPGMPELVLVCGDAHATGFDDGTNVAAAFGVSAAHIAASPLRNSGFAGTGPYAWRGEDTESNTQTQAFVVMDFCDNGGDRVIWTATPRNGSGVTFAGTKGGPFSNADLSN